METGWWMEPGWERGVVDGAGVEWQMVDGAGMGLGGGWNRYGIGGLDGARMGAGWWMALGWNQGVKEDGARMRSVIWEGGVKDDMCHGMLFKRGVRRAWAGNTCAARSDSREGKGGGG